MASTDHPLDDIDLQILHLLQANARVSQAEVARAVGLAPSAILERLRKLEHRGVLKGYVALVDPHAADLRAVVSGHSHRPRVFERDGVLFVNPGSAGRRRFRLPVSIGELRIDGERVAAQLHELPG